MAFPSLSLLYGLESTGGIRGTAKFLGNQWYWVFECDRGVQREIYMEIENEGSFRSLDTSFSPLFEHEEIVTFVSRSRDVLHRLAIPSLSLKLDSVSGRTNCQSLSLSSLGVLYGQCSEVCGANHRFMPVSVEVSRHLAVFFIPRTLAISYLGTLGGRVFSLWQNCVHFDIKQRVLPSIK
jgi:heme/copper-type cytochrome/quinol oxidase subunit 2